MRPWGRDRLADLEENDIEVHQELHCTIQEVNDDHDDFEENVRNLVS